MRASERASERAVQLNSNNIVCYVSLSFVVLFFLFVGKSEWNEKWMNVVRLSIVCDLLFDSCALPKSNPFIITKQMNKHIANTNNMQRTDKHKHQRTNADWPLPLLLVWFKSQHDFRRTQKEANGKTPCTILMRARQNLSNSRTAHGL